MLKGAVKALIPKVELPRYFKIVSRPIQGGATEITATLHVKDQKTYSTKIPSQAPTLIDVVKAFPSLDMNKIPSGAQLALGFIVLPASWDLECMPLQKKEGFRVTLDIHKLSGGSKKWEREFEVTKMQLAELVDVLEWVKEANKVDRFGDGKSRP